MTDAPFPASSPSAIPIRADTDTDLGQRIRLLKELNLEAADTRFDALAADLATTFAAQVGQTVGGPVEVPYAMVNMITGVQRFIGLYNPPDKPPVGRAMPVDHGYCPDLMRREPGKGLALPDVRASPRFSSNPVVDKIGIHTYAGAHVLHRATGTLLGTVCIVGKTPLPLSTGDLSLCLLKRHADQLMDLIDERTARGDSPHASQP